MVADIRREEICTLLKSHSAVSTATLAERFGVSIETIRKDLLFLENESKLVRVHGGAVAHSSTKPYLNLSKRMNIMRTEKFEISCIESSLIKNGDIIAVDTGSTAIEFINVLKDRFDTLTIVTHSMDVFQRACNHKNFNIILCGGYYLQNENSFYGSFTTDMLDKIHVEKSFIFPYALSLKNGICDLNPQLSEIQKKLFSIGDEIVILADSSKYEKSALLKVSDMNPCYTYISDTKLSEEIKAVYRNNDINIITKD